jgi:hypothetical protein
LHIRERQKWTLLLAHLEKGLTCALDVRGDL